MQADHDDPHSPDLSPAKSKALFIAALAVALLGLTVLDLAPVRARKPASAVGSRSFDCIVASAIFVGVSISPATELH